MIGLDTNILVRYFANDDPVQTPLATDLIDMRLTDQEPGYINLVTMAELVWVLTSTHGYRRDEILEVLEFILRASNLILQDERAIFQAFFALRAGRASFPDALIREMNTAAGCPVTLTFDKAASRLSGYKLLTPPSSQTAASGYSSQSPAPKT